MAMTNEQIVEALRLIAESWSSEDFFFRLDKDGNVTILANCSDFFEWGTADAEEITADKLGVLADALHDLKQVQNYTFAREYLALLYSARVRGSRPQGAYYEHLDRSLWPLFDACGSERDVNLFNPKPRPVDE
jgi:hypothetical protein